VRRSDRALERVAPAAPPVARPLAGTGSRRPAGRRETAAGARTRCISEELLHEARRLYRLGLSLRAVAETLLHQTGYAKRAQRRGGAALPVQAPRLAAP
jgi:hypothetical protein